MKKNIIFILFVIFLFTGCLNEGKTTIKISGAFALYPMMGIWADEYEKLNPGIKIDISAGGAGKGMADAIMGIVDIGMVSREIYPEEIKQGIFWVSVAKDAVVATINTKNPIVDYILEKGLTKQQFIEIFITRNIKTWGEIEGNLINTKPIKVYTRSDACGAAQTWAEYLGDYTQDDLTIVADSAINGDPNLAASIQSDIYGIGYNNINFVYDAETKYPFPNIIPVPIDLDENLKLDYYENFYENRTKIVDAIEKNMYPSPPARDLHLVTKIAFTGVVKDFVNWILTDGQKFVTTSGYIKLQKETIESQLEYLETGERPELR